MSQSDPLPYKNYVHADGKLAEFMCQVYLMDLTIERARELRHIHRFHHPDECLVHLAATYLLLLSEGDF
ncbi:hypothetical protein [Nocardia terpenica]|uniref:Uncharacterized protein n=1 Tax=Nocardia terpenica TaxID=455432 RepID=A0A164KYJ3_9NOCA|nr:hypothetical protein [Nocardia terpenica]KZM71851.1 hypothetical protein AWN90_03340 [Nocardia terpenica]NQE91006.1 hypothetical protein [Nocardia terpenica]